MRDITLKCALCKAAFDNDNKGASMQEVPSKLHTEDSIMVQEGLQSFFILACEKDLTGLIDLVDVTTNSGDLKGEPRGPWLQVKRFW